MLQNESHREIVETALSLIAMHSGRHSLDEGHRQLNELDKQYNRISA